MTIEELVGAGFCLVATWQRDESGQGVYKEKKKLPEEPGLYPFVEQRGPVVRHNMSLNAEISFFGEVQSSKELKKALEPAERFPTALKSTGSKARELLL